MKKLQENWLLYDQVYGKFVLNFVSHLQYLQNLIWLTEFFSGSWNLGFICYWHYSFFFSFIWDFTGMWYFHWLWCGVNSGHKTTFIDCIKIIWIYASLSKTIFYGCQAVSLVYCFLKDYSKIRPSQIACTVRTMYVTCMQKALHVHQNLCTVLILLCKNNSNLPLCFFLPCAWLPFPLIHPVVMLATSLPCAVFF